jgi:glycosyltransferase involved in cell wall biosynthesis
VRKDINVLFIPTSNSGIAYWRMYNFVRAMHRNHYCNAHLLWWQKNLHEIHPWQTRIMKNPDCHAILAEMDDWVAQADVVVMQICHTPHALAAIRAIRDKYPRKPFITEADDDVTWTPTYNPAHECYAPGSIIREVAVSQLKESDAVVTSTPYLAEVYSEFSDNIKVIPNCIDFPDWDKVDRGSKPGIRIGWAGGANHDADLEIIKPVVDKIIAKHKDVTFVFVHGAPEYFRNRSGCEYVGSFAKIDKYPKHLGKQDFDIGLFPLVDNSFNRGKSNLRYLEYSALKIPTVAYIKTQNPGQTHIESTIKNGVDGLVANNAKDCIDHLDSLIANRKLRRDIATAANGKIRREFNVDYIAKDYSEWLSQISAKENKDEQDSTPVPTVVDGGRS